MSHCAHQRHGNQRRGLISARLLVTGGLIVLVGGAITVLALTMSSSQSSESAIQNATPTAGAAGGAALAGQTPAPWQYDSVTDKHWDPNHAHWHDGPAPASANPDIQNPEPWQYDPATNKHWDPVHSHWHDGPAPVSPTTAPDDDNS